MGSTATGPCPYYRPFCPQSRPQELRMSKAPSNSSPLPFFNNLKVVVADSNYHMATHYFVSTGG